MLKKVQKINLMAVGGLSFLMLFTLNNLFQQRDKSHLYNGPFHLAPGIHTDDVKWLPFAADTVFVAEADFISYPYQCVADAWGNLYVLDWKRKEIHKFDPLGIHVKTFGGSGSGPGEFGGNARLYITPDRKIIYVDDKRNNRLVQYDTSGTFIKAITGIPSKWKRVMTLDEKVIGAGLRKKPIGSVYSNKGKLLLEFGEHVTASHLVNQGSLWIDRDEQVYFTNDYTSVIQVYRPNGEFVYKIEGPMKYVPKKAIKKRNFQLTGREPKGTLDICTADNFLYVLFSGKLSSSDGRIHGSLSRIVHIYHRKTGDYLGSIELPDLVKFIHVYQDRLFLIQHDEELSRIVAYDLSSTIASLQSQVQKVRTKSTGKRLR